jgi:formate hydrogenlyase transcriptional activator
MADQDKTPLEKPAIPEKLEKDLCILTEAKAREDLLAELERHRNQLQEMVCERTAALEKSREILASRERFERLLSDLSASLVSVSRNRLKDVTDIALTQICRFFRADHCGLFEISPENGTARFVGMTDLEERRQKGWSVDITPDYPWARSQLIEKGEPVIISSLDMLPPEASVDRANLEREGMQALLVLPLHVEGRVTHLIGLRSRRKEHHWLTDQIEQLHAFGEIFAHVLVNKRSHETLQRSERDLAQAQRIACLGSWEWDIRKGTHRWSEEFYRVLGLPPIESAATYEAFLAAVHPDDRPVVHQACMDTISDPGKPYSIEFRIVRPDGTERDVHARADILPDDDGKSARMIGTLQDITEAKRAREDLRKAFEEIKRLKEQTESENVYLRKEIESSAGFPGIIGGSNALKYVKYRIQQVARTKTTALLTGETGTGKGLFAHALHEESDRRDKLFVNVNCAGLPPNLIESELFGREKGAFTGSSARQIGRFELAHGGTLFLDEIGELPLELQAKLLRAIEDGEFERLGSPHPVKVDVRIIASTNRHLAEEVHKGQFRKDLFYRLHVFPITIPPLRQRREDIPALARFFADRFAKNHSRTIKSISNNAMKALESYDWPGNVRELMNVIERSVIVSEGTELKLAEQIDALSLAESTGSARIDALGIKGLSEVEREYILRSLRETGWRIDGDNGAARLLGMNPSTMRARMRKLGIHRPGSTP